MHPVVGMKRGVVTLLAFGVGLGLTSGADLALAKRAEGNALPTPTKTGSTEKSSSGEKKGQDTPSDGTKPGKKGDGTDTTQQKTPGGEKIRTSAPSKGKTNPKDE